jgi:hypothetical protein
MGQEKKEKFIFLKKLRSFAVKKFTWNIIPLPGWEGMKGRGISNRNEFFNFFPPSTE